MNLNSSSIERRALSLALSLAASDESRVSRKVLADHFGAEVDLLISMGILLPDGHMISTATEDDVPAAVEWSAERGCFGYFSETDGWVDLAAGSLTVFTVQIPPLVKHLTTQMDVQPKATFIELTPGLLWELGTCRLPERPKRVSLWVARRLHDAGAWRSFVHATRDRPTQDIRMVLHLAECEEADAPFVPNHAIIAVGAVVSGVDPLQIDPNIAAARLQMPSRAKGPITISADGGHVVVNGNSYTFQGGKHRAIVRSLYEAWRRGEPRCLTEEVLLEAGSADSVRRLARAFRGHPNWHEIIKEQSGFCWLEA